MFTKHRPPPGAGPGTLVIRPGAAAPKLRVMRYHGKELEDRALDDADELARLPAAEGVTWLDVTGHGDEELLQKIGEQFHIHPLALEDVVNSPTRPKADLYDDNHVVVVRMLRMDQEGELVMEQVGLIIAEGSVVTFQETPGDVFDPVRERIRRGSRVREMGADYLAYALIDAIIDGWFPCLELIGDRLEDLEDRAMGEAGPAVLEAINDARRELSALRRALWPMRDALVRLARDDESRFFSDQVRTYLRDVDDHVQHATDIVESYRELANGLMNTYLSVIGNRTNDIMRVLTIVGSIFIPLTFIAGIYGMNFEYMPELKMRGAYFVLLAIMGAAGVGLLLWFRHLGWLARRQ